MGRHKEFDVDAALYTALEVFWRQGYEKTSINDLTSAIGIHRKSLYDTFSNKQSLYEQCLTRYIEELNKRTSKNMEHVESSLERIRLLFSVFKKNERRGCFIVNTISELSNLDSVYIVQCYTFLEDLKRQFIDLIHEGQTKNEVRDDIDTDEIATLYLSTWCGIRILKKTDYDTLKMDAMVHQLINMIKK